VVEGMNIWANEVIEGINVNEGVGGEAVHVLDMKII
jgi:hypothetical protein